MRVWRCQGYRMAVLTSAGRESYSIRDRDALRVDLQLQRLTAIAVQRLKLRQLGSRSNHGKPQRQSASEDLPETWHVSPDERDYISHASVLRGTRRECGYDRMHTADTCSDSQASAVWQGVEGCGVAAVLAFQAAKPGDLLGFFQGGTQGQSSSYHHPNVKDPVLVVHRSSESTYLV